MTRSTLATVAVVMIVVVGLLAARTYYHRQHRYRWVFDHNELGPVGAYGQWWYDVYKCEDIYKELPCPFTRKVLVAGPRG